MAGVLLPFVGGRPGEGVAGHGEYGRRRVPRPLQMPLIGPRRALGGHLGVGVGVGWTADGLSSRDV